MSFAEAVERSKGYVPASVVTFFGRNRNADRFCAALLIVLVVLTWLPRMRGPIDIRWDAGVYYVLGTSLAEGRGYRLLNEPGEIQAIQYPPLLSAIVAIYQKALGTSDVRVVGPWLRFSWFILSVLYTLLTFFLARHFLTLRFAFLLTLICVLNPAMYFLSTLCFAELPFAFITMFFFFLYLKRNHRALTRLAISLAAVAAYLLRTAGIALLAAWVGDALLRRQFRSAALRALVAAIPILLWQYYIHAVESGHDYKHPAYAYQRDPSMFYNVSYAANVSLRSPYRPELGKASRKELIDRFLYNVLLLPSSVGQAFTVSKKPAENYEATVNSRLPFPVLPQWPLKVIIDLPGCLALAGIGLELWKRQWLIGSYTLLSLAAVCVTPWPLQLPRYMGPILPFLLLALFAGLTVFETVLARAIPRFARPINVVATSLVIGIVLCGTLVSLVSLYSHFSPATYETPTGEKGSYQLLHNPPVFSSVEKSLKWLAATNSDTNAVIAVSMPHWAYLKSGLKTVMPPFETDAGRVQALLDSVPVAYAIVEHMLADDSYNDHFRSLVRNSPDKWRLLYSSPQRDVEIYGRVGVYSLASSSGEVRPQ